VNAQDSRPLRSQFYRQGFPIEGVAAGKFVRERPCQGRSQGVGVKTLPLALDILQKL